MPINFTPEEPEEDLYEEINGRPQGEADIGYQNDPPIYQNIKQNSTKRKSVFGEGIYSATGRPAEGQWDPSYQKGISAYPPDTQTTLEEFQKKYEEYLTHIDNTPADEKNAQLVQFLLHKFFPYLESKLAKTGITSDVLNILVRLSCCRKCSLVTRYALLMIYDTISKTSYDTCGVFTEFLVKCGSDLRDSILGQAQEENAVFDYEIAEDQGLRVLVYSRVLMIFYANVMQGLIPPANLGNNDRYRDLVKKLTHGQQPIFEKKDWPRYAVCCIKEIQSRLETPQKKQNKASLNFLTWLQDYNRTEDKDKTKRKKSVEDVLTKLIKASKKSWFDFHVVVFCLASQIKERPRNVEILRTLVEVYLKHHSECARKWSSEGEWQTGLVLGSVLEGIVNHNQEKDTRSEACLCLVYYYESLTKKNSLEKLWAQESLRCCLYGPVEKLRPIILGHLEMKGDEKTKGGKEHLPITRSRDHLLQRYEKQLPKGSLRFNGMLNDKGYFSATFRGEKAAIKILASSKDDIIGEEKKGPTRIHNQLVIEAYTLRRLNSKPHPNILRVFAYDTSAQPYHVITEQVAKGSLLQFLHGSRSHLDYMPSPSELIKMMLGIMDAAIYLNKQHLVHLAITAANVLVAQDNVCKLTGFQFTREMKKQPNGRYEYVCVCDEMAIRHAAPECFTAGRFSEKTVSWAIGVMLFEMHTYGVSPYNQYSNHEAEQIRNYVIAGGKLKMEDCIRKEVLDLITKCLQHESEKRPDLMQLKMELERIYERFTREDNDRPAASYPSLTNVDLDQTNDAMNTSSALQDRDKEKDIGFFGSPTRSHDIPMIRLNRDGKQVIRESVEKTKQEDLQSLKNLKHKNMVVIHSVFNLDELHMALVTEDSGRGNLLQIVLKKQCGRKNLVTFIAQIAHAMEYMHDHSMIHGDLRAEHIMVFSDKVKITRLGRSKRVDKIVDTHCRMPQDAVRWSPPETIKDGIYSHNSDVYSFGIMCFELFTALSAAEGSTAEDVKPFPTIKDDQVLAYLEGNNRPARPESMPTWFYIVVKQCLLHKPAERPPFILIVDALTSRKPFESCLLFHWINRHRNEADHIKTNKTQPEGASHVVPKEQHKTFEELNQSVAVEVFLEHTYSYKPGNKEEPDNEPDLEDQEEPYDDAYGYSKANFVKNEVPEDRVYDQIRPYSDPEKHQRPKRPPPPRLPVQETGNPDSACYASTSIFNTKFSSLYGTDGRCTSEWPSLPSNKDPKNDVKDSTRSSLMSDQSSHVTQTLSYPMPACRPSTSQRVEQIVEEDEGAVGGEPVEGSYYSMPYQDDEYMSMNNHPGAEERSWPSLTPQQNDRSGPSRDRPVPLPRKNKPKHGS